MPPKGRDPESKPAGSRKTTSSVATPSPSRGTTTDALRVRARFTEPLRRTGEYENLRDLITGQAAKYGGRAFLIDADSGREYSFGTLDEMTTRTANVLHDLGAEKGAKVSLLLPNSPAFVFSLLGTVKGGFVAVALNAQLPEEQLRLHLEESGATILITSGEVWERVRPVAEAVPELATVLIDGQEPAPDSRKPGDGMRILDLRERLQAVGAEPLASVEIGWWDEAQIVYTGHNLDRPRGAVLQHRQFMTAARWLCTWLRLGENQRFMSGLPLFHVNAQVGTLFAPLYTGGSVVLNRGFNVARVWSAVERYRVTTLTAVPSMLGILADREFAEAKGASRVSDAAWPAPHESPGTLAARGDADARELGLARGHDTGSLERVICGAAPLPAAVQKRFEQAFLVPVIEGYSMAETTCFATLNPADGTRKIGSVGVPVGDKVCIQAEGQDPEPLTDNWQPTALKRMNPTVFPTAADGDIGEICVWGENLLREYHRRGDENPAAFAGGWFHTGDLGYQDGDGFVFVLGPKDEVIDLDKRRVMPREVDELLFAHSQVEQAATLGITGDDRRPQVTTWVVMRRGTFPGGKEDGRLPADDAQLASMREEITKYVGSHLGDDKRPSTVRFVHRLPRDAAGKTRIVELRQISAAGDAPA